MSITQSLPELREIRSGVWRLAQAMPHPRNPWMFLYLIEGPAKSLHVIDPGWETDENWQAFVSTIEGLGRSLSDVQSIVPTHLHADHIGMADRMRDATGAQIYFGRVESEAMHSPEWSSGATVNASHLEGWGVPLDRRAEILAPSPMTRPPSTTVADSLLEGGDVLPIDGRSIRALATPGHTTGHLCFVDEADRIVFAGDHILPEISPGIGLGGPGPANPLADYLDSLDALRRYDDYEVHPGHEHSFTGLVDRIEHIEEHHLRRTTETAAIVAEHPESSVWQIASHLTWSRGFVNLGSYDLRSALVQTSIQAEYVRSR